MGTPKVSVIVITYNQEDSLPVALDSIVNQECSFDVETIVGEDCSTDKTRLVLEEYASKYKGIIKPLFNKTNQGILRNFASVVSEANGEYVAFCDGDDYWCDKQKLAKQVDILDSNPDIGLVYTDVIMDSRITGQKYYRGMASPQQDQFTQLLKGNIIVSSTVCMRSDLLRFVNFDNYIEQGFLMEDYPMWLSLSLHTRFHYLKEATACYVIKRDVVVSEEVSNHAMRFDENSTKIRLYFQESFADNTSLSKDDILDDHCALGYKCGLNMNDREFALRYVSQMHNRTPYVKRLTMICKSHLLFGMYQMYRGLTGKKRSPLEMYFGM